MKRLGGLWSQVVSFDNLLAAYRQARRGKGRSPGVARFALDLEGELLRLQAALLAGSYRPGSYRLFSIYERKPRVIAAAPFRDRVVHHALLRVIEAPIDRRFIDDSYACRHGRGVHAAVRRYQGWARRYRHVLQLDVARYFSSIDHDVLKALLRRHIKDRQVLALLDVIIDTAPVPDEAGLRHFPGDDLLTPLTRRRGMPIGNLTSQFLANLYLDPLDQHVKQALRVPAYLRYVDDLTLLDDDPGRLRALRDAIAERLAGLRLRLRPLTAEPVPVRCGVDLLGYRVWPFRRRLRADSGRRFAARARALQARYRAGECNLAEVRSRIASWLGHARHADSDALCRLLLGAVVLRPPPRADHAPRA